jgi:PTH2 family peptidyl-tRNA hydrolase
MSIIIGTAIIAGVSGYLIGMASSLGLIPNPFVAKPPRRRGIDNYDDEEESAEEEIDEGEEGVLDHAPNWANGYEADKRDGLRARTASAKEAEKKSKMTSSSSKGPEWQNSQEECKLVLVVRTDLGMTKGNTYPEAVSSSLPSLMFSTKANLFPGKIAAQCSHATLACYKHFLRHDPRSPILRRWEREGQAKVALQVKSEDELALLQAQAISLGLVAEVIADAGRTQIASGSHTVLGIGPAPKSVIDKVTGGLKLL